MGSLLLTPSGASKDFENVEGWGSGNDSFYVGREGAMSVESNSQ